MKIAIISDIHDNLVNLNKCLKVCQTEKIDKIICLGDVCNLDTLTILCQKFKNEIHLVDGNGEIYTKKDALKIKNLDYQAEFGYLSIDNINLAFCHKKKDIDELLKGAKVKPDFIFYGHNHKPWLEKKKNTFWANPGNVAGIYYQPTFAILNTDNKNLSLKLL